MSLHREVVPPVLYKLLLQLMGEPALSDFCLVGGTALALRFGHRESVDIDLFTADPFDQNNLRSLLQQSHGLTESETAENTVRGMIRGIKIDCMAHRYPVLEPVETVDGIRLASLPDAAAMKLNAVANRGSKKDFWDVATLLEMFPLEQMLEFCRRKYRGESVWNIEKSLCFFDDAEQEPDPKDRQGKTWEQIKSEILRQARL